MERVDRREREAQRAAVERVLPGEGSLLRMVSGEVLIYANALDKRRPVELRAVVMPDGHTQDLPSRRFKRR